MAAVRTDSLEECRSRLITVLKQRGGDSLLRGWRRDLDPDGSLDVNFPDFCRAAARLGVEVDAARLFSEDGDSAHLSLLELARSEGEMVQRFRAWVKSAFGSPSAFFSALDAKDGGLVSREDFVEGCRANGFEAEGIGELFSMLDLEDFGSVTEQEVMFLETEQQARETEIFRAKMRSKHQRQRLLAYVYWDDKRRITKATDRRAHRPWLAESFEQLPALITGKRLTYQHSMHRKASEARTAFIKQLRGAFGNEVRAWRRGLDVARAFFVDRTALFQYCRRSDLAVDLPSLWRAMDRDGNGIFTMEELDSHRALVLANLRAWAHSHFGCCANLWELPETVAAREAPQKKGRWVSQKKLMLGVFAKVLRQLGWQGTGRPEVDSLLSSSLDLYGCGFIEEADLEWLDAWEPPEYLVRYPDPGAWANFKELLLQECGEPLRAWRHMLDTNSDNRVGWTEFITACRRLRFTGSAGGAWRVLDRNVDGVVSLREFDAESAELLSSFKEWAEENFGSAELAFKAMDVDGSGTLTFAELRRGCQRLKWHGEVRMLFNCLGGKRSLMVSNVAFLDMWIDGDEVVEAAPEETLPRQRSRPVASVESTKRSCSQAEPMAEVSATASDLEKLRRAYGSKEKRREVPKSKSLPWLKKLLEEDSQRRLPALQGRDRVSVPALA